MPKERVEVREMKYSEEHKKQIISEMQKVRMKKGHGVQKVANVVGVTATYISRLINGGAIPSDEVSDAILRYTHGNYDELELKTPKKDEYERGYEAGYKDAMKKLEKILPHFKEIKVIFKEIETEIRGD
ncbi:hypothetical protein CW684_01015 [Macrococcoides caseolyticum]|uniref:Uncharacterized protein n=2 Tax=Macrococcoides caseolyticum TaxID=69966 RepID=A0ACC9MSK8_9STAP|nr:helix-turn-helix transcriptional regulator [Macrococcus caseolyticus]PKE39512.1 hypothetical protein CW675_06105 [Macrococcus caseolyticus]PKE56777.1 hypothetical protein CW682_04490 [Macrococcus caseolyticus]PKF22417.1 hypothetical protein CW684_01015 [Macrococcus caseolyticus]PKF37020.1 hypothetical protein CW687_00500 [Macrococcus caseolyticus]